MEILISSDSDSDSNDTVIYPIENNASEKFLVNKNNSEIDIIINKYISTEKETTSKPEKSTRQISYNYDDLDLNSSDSEDFIHVPLVKKLNFNGVRTPSPLNPEETLSALAEKYAIPGTNNNYCKHSKVGEVGASNSKDLSSKEQKKIQTEMKKAKKKEEAQIQKHLKQALSAANKNLKPEECMKV